MLSGMDNYEQLVKALVYTYSLGRHSPDIRTLYVPRQLVHDRLLYDDYTLEVSESQDPWQYRVSLIPQPVIERRAQLADLGDRLDASLGLGDDFGSDFPKKLARALYEIAEKYEATE